MHQPKPEFAHL